MPNWAMGECSAVMPERKVDRFRSYFLEGRGEDNKAKERYFARTFLDNFETETNGKGMALVRVSFSSAWSAYSCLMQRRDDPKCITLKEALEECEAKRFTLHSAEEGIGFEESLVYDKDESDEIIYESRDLYKDPWNEFLDEGDVDEEKEGGKECQIG